MSSYYHQQVQEMTWNASRAEEMLSLSGFDPADLDTEEERAAWKSPYQELTAALQEGIEQVAFLRLHQHMWSEDSYCVYCGADGEA